jgi:hypothetical protein
MRYHIVNNNIFMEKGLRKSILGRMEVSKDAERFDR